MALPGSPFPLTCLPGSAHLPSCRFVSAQHGTRMLTSTDEDGELHPAPGAAPYLGHVAACGSKLRVTVKLIDRQGTQTRMSSSRQVQLALLPERELEGNTDVITPYGADAKSFDNSLLAWVSSTIKAQRLAEKNSDTAIQAATGSAGGNHLAPAPPPEGGRSAVPSIAASAAPALAAAATGAFEGAAIVALERVSSERRSVEELSLIHI